MHRTKLPGFLLGALLLGSAACGSDTSRRAGADGGDGGPGVGFAPGDGGTSPGSGAAPVPVQPFGPCALAAGRSICGPVAVAVPAGLEVTIALPVPPPVPVPGDPVSTVVGLEAVTPLFEVPVELTIPTPGAPKNARNLLAYFLPKGAAAWVPVARLLEADRATVYPTGPGLLVVVALNPAVPAGCVPTVMKGTINVASVLDLDGIKGATEIFGLNINDNVDSVLLPCLTKLGNGGLSISSAKHVTAVELPALELVEGAISLSSPLLATFSAPKLRLVRDLFVAGMMPPAPRLTISVPELVVVGSEVSIGGVSVGHEATFGSLVQVDDVLSLRNLDLPVVRFPRLETVGSLNIRENPALGGLHFDSLRRILKNYQIHIWTNPLLTRLSAPVLREIPARLNFLNVGTAPGTITVLDVPLLHTVHGLDLSRVDGLQNLDGFAGLKVVEGQLDVSRNAGLLDASALKNLQRVAGSLRVENNPKLTVLDLSGLTDLPGLLSIDYQPVLTVARISAIKHVMGSLSFVGNGVAGGDLQLDLSGLSQTTSSISISNNGGLKNLSTLAALEISGGVLNINSNADLTALGLRSLKKIVTQMMIRSNKQLPTCEATALRDQLIAAGFTGPATLDGNLPDTCK